MLLALPLACQSSPETQNSDPVINPSENLIPTIVAGSETPSASLRLRYLDEGNLNPLRKHSYVNRSVFSLVYDSLFAFNAAGSLQAQLVESAQVSNDMLTWTLNLKDVNFHSGENLTAADVEASLRLWLDVNLEHSLEEWEDEEQTPPNGDETDPDAEPDTDPDTETDDPDGTEPDDLEPGSEETIDEPDSTEDDQDVDDEIEETSEPTTDSADDTYDYYIDTPVLGEPAQVESFSATYKVSLERGHLIKAIDSSDPSTIKILLHEAAPILDLLTFPIIPAEYTESNSYEIIPGSGSYRIIERDTQGNLHLTAWQQDEAKAKEIIAVNCADVMEALALFENDELDVLLMDRTEASRLQGRSRVRSQDYEDSGFVSLYVPNSNLRAQLETVFPTNNAESISAPFQYSPYYIRPGDVRLLEQSEIVNENDGTSSSSEDDASNNQSDSDSDDDAGTEVDLPVYRILLPRVFYPYGLQNQLTSLIAQIGGEAEYKLVRAEDYEEELKEQDYDLALLLDQSASFGDPFDYALGLLEYELIDNLSVSATQRTILTEGRMKQALMLEEEQGLEARYLQAVHDLFSELPVIGLCTTSTLLWYRDGVEGVLAGTAELPYFGIESLEVWQP